MPRNQHDPDRLTVDIALDAILLIEHGVRTLADMGIIPGRKLRATCGDHGSFHVYTESSPATYAQCPVHRDEGWTMWCRIEGDAP